MLHLLVSCHGGINCAVCVFLCDANLFLCAEVSCGPPLTLPHTNLGWDGTSRPGSVVLYECVEGFYQMSGNNISTCLLSGQWGKVSVKCKGTVIIYICASVRLHYCFHVIDIIQLMLCFIR